MISIDTVCLILGPYRNLTTLTASCLMLHPQIQVLNHGSFFNDDKDTNFLKKYSDKKFNTFIDKAVIMTNDGVSIPGKGGTITASHAFRDYADMRDAFSNRFENTKKEYAKSLIWKESHINTKLFKQELFNKNDKIRAMLPIRNPLDCATSCESGYAHYFDKNIKTKEDVLKALMKLYSKLLKIENDKFLKFFQFEMNESTISKICNLLQVDNDPKWKMDLYNNWNIKKSYTHTNEFIDLYHNLIDKYFSDNILLRSNFLLFK